MRIYDYILLSQKNLLRRKLRTGLTLIAIFIGAFTLSLTNGVGEGVKQFLTDEILSYESEYPIFFVTNEIDIFSGQERGGGPAGEIPVYQEEKQIIDDVSFIPLQKEDCENIKQAPYIKDVKCVRPLQLEYISVPGETKYLAELTDYFPYAGIEIVAGRTISEDDKNTVVLTERYAQALGFETPKDAIGKTIYFGAENPLGEIKEFPATIVGVQPNTFVGGGQPVGSNDLTEEIYQYSVGGSEKFLNSYVIALIAVKKDASETEIKDFKDYLENKGYQVETIESFAAPILGVIDTAKWVLNGVGILVLLVAGFGIANTLLMSVYERTREIGLMRALGMSKGKVFLLFSFEAIMIGFWGSAAGVVAGIITGKILSTIASNTFLSSVDNFTLFVFPIIYTALIILAIMFLAFIAGIIPAVKASSLNPIEALRHE